VLSASVSSSRVRYFSSISVKVRVFLRLDVVKLVVRSASYTGIRTYIVVSLAGFENYSVITLLCGNVTLPSFILESIDKSSSVTTKNAVFSH
jgi:hypothetical protein